MPGPQMTGGNAVGVRVDKAFRLPKRIKLEPRARRYYPAGREIEGYSVPLTPEQAEANRVALRRHRLRKEPSPNVRVRKADLPDMNRAARRAAGPRDPQKAYEAAKAKGYPHDFNTFMSRQGKPSANQVAQAAVKEAKQHTVDAGTIRKLPWHAHINRNQALNAAGSLALAGAAGGLVHHRRQQMAKRDKTNAALGAVAGAGAADAAYVVGGQAAKARIKVVQQRRGFTPAEQETWAKHKQAAGLKPGEKMTGKTPASIKHKVFAHYPKTLPAWRAQRLLGWKNNRAVNAAVVGSAAAAGALHASRPRRQAPTGVGKRLTFSQAGLLTGSGAAGTVIGARGTKHDDESREALGATVGGWAGQGAYQAAGYGPRKLVRGVGSSRVPLHERDVPKSQMRTQAERKSYDQFRRERRALRRQFPDQVQYKRNTPLHWHGGRLERVLGHTHGGKTGTAIGGAATLAGVAAGAEATRRRKVEKAEYGYMDKERSVPKTTEMLAGLGLLAWGGPRLRMLGPAAAKGVKLADKHGAGKEARAALELARAFGEKTRDITGRGETQLRRIKTLDSAVRKVPAAIRPEVATAAGALVSAHAHPTTKERFTPLGGQ